MAKEKNSTTEAQILWAAKAVFQQKGLDGARMQEIADEAGINKAMLHYYFKSKQSLFEAVFENAFMLLAPQMNKILNDDSSIEDKIRNFTSSYISFVSVHPYIPNFVIQEMNRNPDFIIKIKTKLGLPTIEKFKKQVATEVENGILKPTSAEQLFVNLLSLSVFPFIGANLIKTMLNASESDYNQLIEARKTEVANFIIYAIKI